MSAHVVFQLADGTLHTVGEGCLIGRAATAQLRLDDPAVSEAHALISLRGNEVRILALRGRVVLNDVPVAEAPLHPRQRVTLTPSTTLVVHSVELPAARSPGPNITKEGEPRPVDVQIGSGVVRIQEGDDPPLLLGGNQADLLRLLAETTEPAHWTTLARYFWPERDQPKWRDRFDALLKEVRSKLRDHRIRADLVWSWDGNYRLQLHPSDRLSYTSR